MRLKTKLVLAATAMTFAIVMVLSLLFLGELLRQRIAQTSSSDDVLVREVLMMTRQAIEVELPEHPPVDRTDAALYAAVTDALRSHQPLSDVMNSIVRYSPAVQDVSVTDAHGYTLISTDADALGQMAAPRMSFVRLRDGSVTNQMREMFGRARVLDVTAPLDRNGRPFLVVHMGIRSSFLKNYYAPFLRAAVVFVVLAGIGSIAAAGLLASVALRPIEEISRRLDVLAVTTREEKPAGGGVPRISGAKRFSGTWPGATDDAVVRVTHTIDQLGQQMRTAEEGYTALQANLNQMLDTLRDGVLLFTPERRAVMVSDAVAHFVGEYPEPLVGRRLEEIFSAETALGAAVLTAFDAGAASSRVTLEDGREVEIAIDRLDRGHGAGGMGTMVTLHDIETAAWLEQELEVSRRLAAIGRLTAGVGHEVKNPINAMVVHLELLRGKLEEHQSQNGPLKGAQRHVDILEGEMHRLDRVVQTLADFSRPLEVNLREQDLRGLVNVVVELTGGEMEENRVVVRVAEPSEPVMVRADGELIRQALLNLTLNGMQAMPEGGTLWIRLRRERQFAVLEVVDEGGGIPPEVMPKIFDLYFTTKEKGSGIGLAMTYRILQMHGGAMEVRTAVAQPDTAGEHGTTFTLRLPLASAMMEERRGELAGGIV
ncbi:two-component sensor histidine kinase [Granulicella sp. WH15]|uniref:sensor histidine kinase n=1 Tax=Granulicella sp. WH15 TaxID=2602070 RepID=UPI0013670EFD|nr:ATP-binding protein [Granulicella sp. WH15]QHN03192.1 two-component sensor histidine kinase [Granulicella sp. WH15]